SFTSASRRPTRPATSARERHSRRSRSIWLCPRPASSVWSRSSPECRKAWGRLPTCHPKRQVGNRPHSRPYNSYMASITFLDEIGRVEPLPVYVVHGDEDFLRRQVLTALKEC